MSHFASPDGTASKDYDGSGSGSCSGVTPWFRRAVPEFHLQWRARLNDRWGAGRPEFHASQRIASVTDATVPVILSKWIAHKLLTFSEREHSTYSTDNAVAGRAGRS